MNEPRLIGSQHEWQGGTPEAWENINKLNDCFVKTIRASGGYNPRRYLLLPTYCAKIYTEAMEALRLPDSDRLIVSLHFYEPYDFAQEKGRSRVWDSGNPDDTMAIDRIMDDINRIFIQKGIKVMITEFGAADKDNEASRIAWTAYVLEKARQQGIPCIWWDAGGAQNKNITYSLLDRYTLRWRFPGIVSVLTKSLTP
jgi:endoglucanase